MNNTTIIAVIASLVIGGGAGFFAGKSGGASSADSKKLQDAVVMMKDQSRAITEMADMMQRGGMALQEAGSASKNDSLVQQGKDLQAIGAQYIEKNKAQSAKEGMNEVMQ